MSLKVWPSCPSSSLPFTGSGSVGACCVAGEVALGGGLQTGREVVEVLLVEAAQASDQVAHRLDDAARDEHGEAGGEQQRDGQHDQQQLRARAGAGRQLGGGVRPRSSSTTCWSFSISSKSAGVVRRDRAGVEVARPVALLDGGDRLGARELERLLEVRAPGVGVALDPRRAPGCRGSAPRASRSPRSSPCRCSSMSVGDLVLRLQVAVEHVEMLGGQAPHQLPVLADLAGERHGAHVALRELVGVGAERPERVQREHGDDDEGERPGGRRRRRGGRRSGGWRSRDIVLGSSAGPPPSLMRAPQEDRQVRYPDTRGARAGR